MISQEKVISAFRNDVLNLIVMPTEQCNFRCTYCYEDFQIGEMPDELALSLKKLIEKRAPNLSYLNLSWFGGEPLLSLDKVIDITKFAKESMPSDGEFRSNASTNAALLTLPNMKKLVDAGLDHFQVSLDGTKDFHNLTRVNLGRGGTFEKIWQNCLSWKQLDVKFDITFRVHITRENKSTIPTLVDQIVAEFGDDPRYKMYFKAVEALGPDADTELLIERNEGDNLITKLEEKAREVGMFDERDGSEVCYAAMPNSLVIRANGLVAKCTVALNDQKNLIGTLNRDGVLNINQKKLRPWFEPLLAGNEVAAKCPYYSI